MQKKIEEDAEKYKSNEVRIHGLLKQQERMAEKWRTGLNDSVKYFERFVGNLNNQIKTLKKE